MFVVCRLVPRCAAWKSATASRAESSRADRADRVLGFDRDSGLALANGDAEERRLPGRSLTPAAAKVADAWDPAKDEAAGQQCKSYGAPALMSVPGRIHITWQDDNTLKVDTDAGTQTRLLRFGAAPATANTTRTWQGVSQAEWLMARPNVPLQLRPAERAADTPPIRPAGGWFQVVTRNLARDTAEERRSLQRKRRDDRVWDVSKRPNGRSGSRSRRRSKTLFICATRDWWRRCSRRNPTAASGTRLLARRRGKGKFPV